LSTYHGLEVGDVIDLEIKEKARDGRGLGRSKGLLIFVEGASPGETVKAKIIKLGARHADAEVVTAHHKAAMAKARP
jgi:23S rRNA (uracil1939-C5)-methyltransferase